MKTQRLKTVALSVVLMLIATMATAQTVNMSKYITLTVRQGQRIQFNLMAAVNGTPVRIVSGANEWTVTVSTWWSLRSYTAEATTMTVYGDITRFDCGNNEANLTALDVTQNAGLTELYCHNNQLTALDVTQNTALIKLYCHNNQLTALDVSQNTALIELYCQYNQLTALNVSQNTALTWLWCWNNQLTALDVSQNTALIKLYCHGNNFTTQAFDDLMCSLPAHTTTDNARFYPLYNASDATAAAFMAANSQIAEDKNWWVHYSQSGAGYIIPPTTGTYTCPTTTGIGEVASVALTLYPNPASDILTIETEATGSPITMTDLSGRAVLTATATDGKTTLNIAHLSEGTYMVRVGDKIGKVVKK